MAVVIVGLSTLSINYLSKYRTYKNAEQNAYTLGIDSIASNGIAMPLFQSSKALELINQNSPEMKKGVETWLPEAASNLSVAQKSADIASLHLTISRKEESVSNLGLADFFGALNTSILDIVHTEKDFEQWKQACIELNDIMIFLDANVDDNVLENGDYYEVHQQWNQLMKQIHQKHPNSRLLKPYNFVSYAN